MDDAPLISAWRAHATHQSVEAFFLSARARISDVVRSKRPICVASGACCKFEAYGHRMYVTGLEAAFVSARIDAARALRASNPLHLYEVRDAHARGDCPYLRAGLCGEHLERPLGCRIFFCDKQLDVGGSNWQSDLYETLHSETIALHERLAIPYRYLDWREALALVTADITADTPPSC